MNTLSRTEVYLERLDNRIGLRVSETDYPAVSEFASLFWSRLQEEDLATAMWMTMPACASKAGGGSVRVPG